MRSGRIAVFDIGKTNKKFSIYDSSLRPVFTSSVQIGEMRVGDLLCDDAESILKWVRATLGEWRGKLSAIAVTSHGATLALLNEAGELVMPIISYNHEIEEGVKRSFYEEFGAPEELYMRTGTPPLGQLLNAGLQLYWVARRFPEKYQRVKRVLFFPQYIVHAISGLEAAELTSIGCHTYLWDLLVGRWSSVAEGLDVPPRSPSFRSVWEGLGEADRAVITPGIHDSNAALLPYLVTEKERFLLASTGTWCVLMLPGAPFAPSPDDVYRDVLYYVDAYGRPLRAARFKCGYEFDCYVDIIRRWFGADPLKLEFDARLATEVLKEGEVYFVPTLTPGTGQFPRSKGRVEGKPRDPARAYYYLNLSLAIQTWYAVRLVAGGERLKVHVQGGFARNPVYLAYLATLLRDCQVIRAENPEATSVGAALTALCAMEGSKPWELEVEIPGLRGKVVEPLDVGEEVVNSYVERFLERCGENRSTR